MIAQIQGATMNSYQFFLKNAGYCYGPHETKMQGRIRGARALADAERKARNGGFSYRWTVDEMVDSNSFEGSDEPWQLWQCGMYNSEGRIVNSLHAIDFGRDKSPWSDPYRRVVEAELAIDGLTNEPQ